jgi:RNA recognition motif-containing protein
MIKKLFVGGLPYETTQEELAEMFAACGKVDNVTLIMDGFSGRSKGFGFVEMSTEAEAAAAVAQLNGTALGERQLCVSEARPQEPRPGVEPALRPGAAPAQAAFVERRSGLKDRRRQQSAGAGEPAAAQSPRPQGAGRRDPGEAKKPTGRHFKPVRKPKDFGGRKKRDGKHSRAGRRKVRSDRSRPRAAGR